MRSYEAPCAKAGCQFQFLQDFNTGFVTPSVVSRRLLSLGFTCKEMLSNVYTFGFPLLAPRASKIACHYILNDEFEGALFKRLSELPSSVLEALKVNPLLCKAIWDNQ